MLAAGADINVRPSCLKTGQDGDSEDEDESWNVCVEGESFGTYMEPPPPLVRACEILSRRDIHDAKAKQLGDDFYVILNLEEQETPQLLLEEELEFWEEESQESGEEENHQGSLSEAAQVQQEKRRAEKRRILNKKKIERTTAMVELLLLSNADPNLRAVKNERVQAALMFASYATNKIGVVTPLLESGADINFANAEGFTALMVAVKASQRNIGVVSALLAGGADVNAVSIHGDTALKLAKLPGGWGKRLLKKHGAMIPLHQRMQQKNLTTENSDEWTQNVTQRTTTIRGLM